jgi:hypothetical protein
MAEETQAKINAMEQAQKEKKARELAEAEVIKNKEERIMAEQLAK